MSGDRPKEHEPTLDQTNQLAQADAQNLASQSGVGSGTAMSLDSLSAPGTASGRSADAATSGDLPASPFQAAAEAGQTTQPADLTPLSGDPGSKSTDTSRVDTGRTASTDDAVPWLGSGTAMPLDFLQALLVQPDQPPVPAQDQPGNTDSASNADDQPPVPGQGQPGDSGSVGNAVHPLTLQRDFREPPGFEPTRETWTENQIERAARESGSNKEGNNNEHDRLHSPSAMDQESKWRQGDRPRTPGEKGNETHGTKSNRGARDATNTASDLPRNPSADKNGADNRVASPSAGNRENNPRGEPSEVKDRASRLPESNPTEALRDYLRQPENRTTARDGQSLHKAAMSNIWDRALTLTHDDPMAALTVAMEAVKSGRQHGETKAEYVQRLDGVPSLAFGTGAPNAGVDKPQHFFATARESFAAAIGTMDYDPISRTWSPPMTGIGEAYGNVVGRLYEVKDGIEGLWSRTGGYDSGDVHADDLGAAFGAALASQFATPDQLRPGATLPRISDYLK
jgi:hypothetical protein